jgi:hypothetical protein
MSEEPIQSALRTAACLAFRHIHEVGASEREQVLIALIEVLPEAEAALAEQVLFHAREERRLQMELGLMLDAARTKGAKNG